MEKIKDILNNKKKEKRFDVFFFQAYLNDLYFKINKDRDFSDIYGNLHRNIGFLGKSIESNEISQSNFVFIISWLFAIANKLNINLLKALVFKFPGMCPYCLEKKCICYKTKKKPNKKMTNHEIEEERRFIWGFVNKSITPYGLDKTVEFITNIYQSNEIIWAKAGFQYHLLKIHQEMTEVHEAYGKYRKNNELINSVMDEIADVFAWVLSAWSINFPDDSLDKAFLDHYYDGCPVCKKAPCKCEKFDSPPATLPDFTEIRKIKMNLEKINGILPEQSVGLDELISTYDEVIISQSMPQALSALYKTKEILGDLQKIITTIDPNGFSEEFFTSTFEIVNKILIKESHQGKLNGKYDVFLSYSVSNKEKASEIYNFLSANKINAFMSERSIMPGDEWENTIRNALINSRVFCLLASPESMASKWVEIEIHSTWALGNKVIPILYRCNNNDLPEIIRKYQCIDFNDYKEIIEIL